MRIKTKILVVVILMFIPFLILLNYLIPYKIEKNLIIDMEDKLLSSKRISEVFINQNLEHYTEEELSRKASDVAIDLQRILNLRISIYSKNGLVGDSLEYYSDITPEVKVALKGETAYRKSEEYIFFAFPIKDIGAVRLIESLDNVNKIVEEIKRTIFSIVVTTLIVFISIAIYLSQKLSRPIVNLNKNVKKIKDGQYDFNIKYKSKDEVGELTKSFIDMSKEIKNKISQLEIMVERERRLQDLQKDFLNNVTHEFKTPLTSIIGYVDLLEQYRDDPKLLNDSARVIKDEGIRLYNMVEKVLYLSAIERYDFDLELSVFNIEELIDESLKTVSRNLNMKNIAIKKNVLYSGDIMADFDMLYRLLVNLLDNGIKYNNEFGIIEITLDKKDKVIISVKDTGIGIEKYETDKIFKPFYRENKDRSRKRGGDGLGLSIVKKIVEKHNGDIIISSVKGEGTEVIVRIPIKLDDYLVEHGTS